MTERVRTRDSNQHEDDGGLDMKKTTLVLIIVFGCFAVLWPKLFYPMLVSNLSIHPNSKDTGCCDMISEVDVDTIKIMSELCNTLIEGDDDIVSQCSKAVLDTCGIDISAALQDRISLGHSTKQILEEVRSLNGSLCLKYYFGMASWKLGVHRVNLNLDRVNLIRQERSAHLTPGGMHPAFRERGRAIPESSGIRRNPPPSRVIEGRPGPIPGMRAAMGGHMVPPSSKQSNYGFMGVLMPLYTIGFVIFFAYTIGKFMCKKKPDQNNAPLYPPCDVDEGFRRQVFADNDDRGWITRSQQDETKIGQKEKDLIVNAVAALLEEVEKEIEAHKAKGPPLASSNEQERPNGSLIKEDEGHITVMGMETRASAEDGKRWSRPDSPTLPQPPPPKGPPTPPQQIFLDATLPPQSQLLVADSAIDTMNDDDSAVVLSGKMTLSVISLDSEESSSGSRKDDEERRTSSSNMSEEFEKINATELEEQIDHIIEEAETIALEQELISSKDEEKELECAILEEIQKQFNLEEDLLKVVKKDEENQLKNYVENEILVEDPSAAGRKLLEALDREKEAGNDATVKADEAEDLKVNEVAAEKHLEALDKDIEEVLIEKLVNTVSDVFLEDTPKELVETTDETNPQREIEEQIEINTTEREPQSPEDLNSSTLLEDIQQPLRQQVEDLQRALSISLDLTSPIQTVDQDHLVAELVTTALSDSLELIHQNDSEEPHQSRPSSSLSQRIHRLGEPTVEEILREELITPAQLSLDGIQQQSNHEPVDVASPDTSSFERVEADDDDMEEQMIEEIIYDDEDDIEPESEEEDIPGNGVNTSDTSLEEDIEEIIEYVDNTDEEGEEIIEVNGNEHLGRNGAH